ncbi:MAG: glutamate mutase L [Peptococcaceae bacterium]
MSNINLLIFDVGSTYTKLSGFQLKDSDLLFIDRTQVPTTVADIELGFQNAKQKLSEQGNDLSADSIVLSTSSAAGGLRMVALGYMPRVTAKAAKEVAMSAGARVLEIISHEDQPEYRIQVLKEIKPDIILLAGGTDGGDQDSMLENTQIIIAANVQAVVIIAGNKYAQPKVAEILAANHINSIRVPNLMPTIHELKVKPAREAIHRQFIKQIITAKGLSKLIEQVSNNKIIPTPGAILLGAELLAKGIYGENGVGNVLIIDIGGATTDIHSVLPELENLSIEEKGLIVNNEKQPSYRTVEGNLGLRVSATGIVETIGPLGVLTKIGFDKKYEESLVKYTEFLEKNTDYIPQNEVEMQFDIALSISAIEIALKRHAGFIAKEFDPLMGITPGTPIGRDLRKIKHVIAVGGIFTHSAPDVKIKILTEAFRHPGLSLLPQNPDFIIDENYLMYAIGVLAQEYSEYTLEFAKKYFKLEE